MTSSGGWGNSHCPLQHAWRPSEETPQGSLSMGRNGLLHPYVMVMCHVKTLALPCERGMMLKIVSAMPQLISARVTLLWCLLMGREGSQVPVSTETSCLLPQGCQDRGYNKNPWFAQMSVPVTRQKTKRRNKKSSSSADNLLTFLSFHFGQAIFMPWLLNTQSFCKAVLVASFSTTEKDVGVQFMSLQIFRTRFQLESRKFLSHKSPFPSSWGGPRVAERSSNQMFQEKLADRHRGTIYSCLDAGTVVLQSCQLSIKLYSIGLLCPVLQTPSLASSMEKVFW